MCWLTADVVIDSSVAALLILPVSTVRENTRSVFINLEFMVQAFLFSVKKSKILKKDFLFILSVHYYH